MAIDSKVARPGVAPIAAALLLALAQPSIAQPLASWNDSPAKAAIVQFVKDVDAQGTPSFVPPDEGIPPEQVIGSQGKDSDGDLEMLQWASTGPGRRFPLIVHHTDAEREWACERTPGFGELDKALREARTKGWIVVDMKRDWTKVHAFE